MQRFRADQLKHFLRTVDSHLDRSVELIVIGGTAALLAYGAQRTTSDIDTAHQVHREIKDAVDAARRETGLNISVEHPGVEDPPYNFEERLQTVHISGLKKLTIKVPEKHDLVLMKTVRGQENDLQVAEEIHRNHPLDINVLIGRWVTEVTTQAIGDPRRLDGNLLVLVERLFGDECLVAAQERLDARR